MAKCGGDGEDSGIGLQQVPNEIIATAYISQHLRDGVQNWHVLQRRLYLPISPAVGLKAVPGTSDEACLHHLELD